MVVVRGNLDDFQSSVDFYINIINSGYSPNSKILQKHFFDMFEREDALRTESYLSQEVCSYSYDSSSSDTVLEGDEEEFVFGGDCLFANQSSNEYPDDSEVFVSDESNSSSISGDEEIEEVDGDSIIPKYEDIDEDFITPEYEEVEDDDFVTQDYEDIDEGGIWSNISEEVLEDDNPVSEDKASKVETDDKQEDLESFDFAEFTGDSDIDINDLLGENIENKNRVVTVDRKNEITDVPNDLREFVKMYPNCEISLAMKYFSKKEIDKQLSLGRVFKRKNKLLI